MANEPKASKRCGCCRACCSRCCGCLGQLLRTIPLMGLLSMAACVAGTGLGLHFLSEMVTNLQRMDGDVPKYAGYLHYLQIAFFAVTAVDLLGTLVGFMAAGAIRDCLFRSDSRRCHRLCCFCQLLAGPCIIRLLQTLIGLLFLVLLLFSYVLLLVSGLVFGAGLLCTASGSTIDNVQKVIDDLNRERILSLNVNLPMYCDVAQNAGNPSLFVFAAIVLLVLVQGSMLACLASYRSRILDAMNTEKTTDAKLKQEEDETERLRASQESLRSAQDLERAVGEELEAQLKAVKKEREDIALQLKEALVEKEAIQTSSQMELSNLRAKTQFQISELTDELSRLRALEQLPPAPAEKLAASAEKAQERPERWAWLFCKPCNSSRTGDLLLEPSQRRTYSLNQA
eukprot:TRINITY_DN77855_c0_g1_i1.p1 TRINITY_DN77855_c0_g1~~TRINITY_DN77855_c0_g1_i1.p1  ORF type:complete len:411 (-),score=76.23 TRINITY_DN77855_c0_g1_i1:49-1245(-)